VEHHSDGTQFELSDATRHAWDCLQYIRTDQMDELMKALPFAQAVPARTQKRADRRSKLVNASLKKEAAVGKRRKKLAGRKAKKNKILADAECDEELWGPRPVGGPWASTISLNALDGSRGLIEAQAIPEPHKS